jgi:hypothetical protein
MARQQFSIDQKLLTTEIAFCTRTGVTMWRPSLPNIRGNDIGQDEKTIRCQQAPPCGKKRIKIHWGEVLHKRTGDDDVYGLTG